ncbi:RHS repeat-associated core domain-containing protein [Sorangium sp. So ce124]|uniref:RHS repeat-associated core domain-containing protein n=1 Tax=Sorangium sp. So ce124 TaxID=3133280 RepID=UPI003F643297
MARTAPVPNIPAIPGMNPGTFILGGGGGGGGGRGRGGRGRGGDQGAGGKSGGKGPRGGGKNAGTCGPGSGGGCPNPSHGRGGGTSAGDPVDPMTGRVYTAKAVDLALGGMILPLRIERSYSSETSDVDLGLGFGWSHSLAWAIEERRRTLRVLEPHAAPTEAEIPEPDRPVPMPCGVLRRHEGGYTLEAEGVLLVFGERQESRWLLSRIVDRYDNEIRLSYERGRLSHAIDAVGRMVRARRHADGRIAAFEVKDESPGGGWRAFRTYIYDDRGDLVSARDAAGSEERYEYDEQHRLVRRREPGGLVAEFRYGDNDRCVEAWCRREGNDALDGDVPGTLDDGETRAKGFCHVKIDDYDHFVEVITSRAKRRIEGNQLDKVNGVAWDGGMHAYTFDATGNVLVYRDALGHAWRYERDDLGRLRVVTDPMGARTVYEYDERGFIEEVRDAMGGLARYQRNARGDVVAVEDELGPVVGFRYDERGLLVEATLPNGGVTRMAYDALGNRVEVIEPDGARRKIRYDFLGRLTSFVDERGLETSYGYDGCGRLLRVRRPSGATDWYGYDVDGNLSEIADADGRVTALRWGGIGVVTEVVKPDGSAVRYFYDREQDLVRVVNESGEEHRYVRRGEGRIDEERTFDGRRIYYRHDVMGRITQIRDGLGTVDFVYDPCGRLVERSFTDGRTESLGYDLLGRVEYVTSGEVACEYTYDARGRVVREAVTRGGRRTVVETAHDALGKAVSTSGPFGRMEIARDVVGRPVTVAVGDVGAQTMKMQMAYDPAGHLLDRVLPAGGRIAEGVTQDALPSGVQVTGPSVTPAMRPGEPAWVGPLPHEVMFAQSYGWSAAGQLGAVGSGEAGGAYVEYLRDAQGRVVGRERVDGARRELIEGYRHGPSGQLYESATLRQYAPGGQLKRRGGAELAYDERGRMTSKRLPGGRVAYFEWGDDDLLQAVRLPDGRVVRFAYDPFARRLEKRVERGRDRVVESVTRYTWSGDALVHEIRELFGEAGREPVVEERAYAVLPDGVTPLADRVRRGDSDEVRYYVEAPNGMPAALVGGNGRLVGEIEASLFGKVEGEQAGLTPMRFPGQYADEETELYYNRYRYYDPETGLYLSPEPIRLEGSLRTYAYVDGWPLEFSDFNGLSKMHTEVTGSYLKKNGKKANVTKFANSGRAGSTDLHPAVEAALAPNNARPSESGGAQNVCSEPKALSDYLKQWEQDTGKMCRPGHENWQQHLGEALESVGGVKSYRGSDKSQLEQACPNCSQAVPRLWSLAGLPPPGLQTVPGGFTSGSNPSQNTTGPNYGPSWVPGANRTQSPTREGMFMNKEGRAAEPGAWNWDGKRWTKL